MFNALLKINRRVAFLLSLILLLTVVFGVAVSFAADEETRGVRLQFVPNPTAGQAAVSLSTDDRQGKLIFEYNATLDAQGKVTGVQVRGFGNTRKGWVWDHSKDAEGVAELFTTTTVTSTPGLND